MASNETGDTGARADVSALAVTQQNLTRSREELPVENAEFSKIQTGNGKNSEIQISDIPVLSREESPWSNLPKWKSSLVMAGLFLGLFFSTLDTSIVATALVAMLEDFDNFSESPWIVLAYLLTYMSFAMVFARLSDIYGRKTIVAGSWIIFTAFSLGCGLAQSMNQLIIFRAFQGLGGSGLYSMTMVMIPEVVPPEKTSMISGLIAMTLAFSGFLGPVLGGVISNQTTWRWIFFINVPIGCLVIVSIFVAWPHKTGSTLSSRKAFMSIDFIGVVLILAASILHTYGFEAAGSMVYKWNSPVIIALLVVSGSSWVMFITWEVLLEARKHSKVLPIFPMRIIRKRVMASAVVSTFLTGFPYITSIVTLPERFQLVNGTTSLMAGVYILPLLFASAFGSFIGGGLSSKRNNTAYTLIVASILQLLGVALLSTLGSNLYIPPRQYVFQAILGLGIGLSLSSATIMTSIQAERGDLAAAQGAISQLRVLGGLIGLTIATTLFNRRSDAALSESLTTAQLNALHKSPLAALSFSTEDELFVRGVYAGTFSTQMRVLTYIAAVSVIVSLFSWERRPGTVAERMRVHRRGGEVVDDIKSRSKV